MKKSYFYVTIGFSDFIGKEWIDLKVWVRSQNGVTAIRQVEDRINDGRITLSPEIAERRFFRTITSVGDAHPSIMGPFALNEAKFYYCRLAK